MPSRVAAANGKSIKEWAAVGIAVMSFAFSAGGWYFKVTELENQIEEMRTSLVRKDVLQVQLESIDSRLKAIETAAQKLDVKLDAVSVAIGVRR